MPPVKIDTNAVRALADVLKETDLNEIEYQVDSLRIKILKSQDLRNPETVLQKNYEVNTSITNAEPPQLNAKTSESDPSHPGTIEAQMVGTIYLSPNQGAKAFINVGDTVTEGETIFIIEAMKVMNMIKSPRTGTVKHIFVNDAQPVEYGDPIVVID